MKKAVVPTCVGPFLFNLKTKTMEHARRSYTGIKYLPHVLLEKPLTVTRIMLWDIAHHDTSIVDVRMKIGRYAKKKSMFGVDSSQVDTLEPKSELTLDSEEISKLDRLLGDTL